MYSWVNLTALGINKRRVSKFSLSFVDPEPVCSTNLRPASVLRISGTMSDIPSWICTTSYHGQYPMFTL